VSGLKNDLSLDMDEGGFPPSKIYKQSPTRLVPPPETPRAPFSGAVRHCACCVVPVSTVKCNIYRVLYRTVLALLCHIKPRSLSCSVICSSSYDKPCQSSALGSSVRKVRIAPLRGARRRLLGAGAASQGMMQWWGVQVAGGGCSSKTPTPYMSLVTSSSTFGIPCQPSLAVARGSSCACPLGI
jgi:hypothetical protein